MFFLETVTDAARLRLRSARRSGRCSMAELLAARVAAAPACVCAAIVRPALRSAAETAAARLRLRHRACCAARPDLRTRDGCLRRRGHRRSRH
ncbi:hypothetical protein, partial [Burkholderia dolosa]